jgi:nucleotidyltransferase substrate binding protein (TIGR01987 family)
MEEIKEKLSVLLDAVKSLEKGIALFYKYEGIFNKQKSNESEELFEGMRDSMIQRFEYCVDIIWKIVKTYLESVEKIALTVNSPRAIVRESVKARIISEQEGEGFIAMIEARNKTSHAYHEVMADEIARKIPLFYPLIRTIAERMEQGVGK